MLKGCPSPVRARGLCNAHYQAHFIRKQPIEELLPGLGEERVRAAVQVQTRISQEESEKLDKAIADRRVKLTRYTFLQKSIRDAIKAL